jgi:protein TonB
MTSLVAHGLCVTIAVMLTSNALGSEGRAAEHTIPLFVAEPSGPAHRTRPAPEPPAEPPTLPLQTIPPMSEMPSGIPPIDLSQRPFDPRDFLGISSEKEPTDRVSGTVVGASGDRVYPANAAIEGLDLAVLLSQPAPKYPAALESVGVEGSVVLEFVIDTTGRVERQSVRIVESGQRPFDDAARQAVLGARFQPARLSGRPVRQMARQTVRFLAKD